MDEQCCRKDHWCKAFRFVPQHPSLFDFICLSFIRNLSLYFSFLPLLFLFLPLPRSVSVEFPKAEFCALADAVINIRAEESNGIGEWLLNRDSSLVTEGK